MTIAVVARLHSLGTVMTVTPTEPPLRVPVTVAASRGVSWLIETAATRRVLLTRFGRVDAVVDSAERLDATAAVVAAARVDVVEAFADAALRRSSRRSLAEVCERLGIEPQRVRARSQQLRAGH